MSNEKGNTPVLVVARDQASPFEYRTVSCRNGGTQGVAMQVLLCGVQSDGTVTPVLVDSTGKLVTTTTP